MIFSTRMPTHDLVVLFFETIKDNFENDACSIVQFKDLEEKLTKLEIYNLINWGLTNNIISNRKKKNRESLEKAIYKQGSFLLTDKGKYLLQAILEEE